MAMLSNNSDNNIHRTKNYYAFLYPFCNDLLRILIVLISSSEKGFSANVKYMVKFKWILIFQDYQIWLYHLLILLSWMMWGSILVFAFGLGNHIRYCHLYPQMGSLSSCATGISKSLHFDNFAEPWSQCFSGNLILHFALIDVTSYHSSGWRIWRAHQFMWSHNWLQILVLVVLMYWLESAMIQENQLTIYQLSSSCPLVFHQQN